ncbi:MAG: hypothetical protein RIT81_02525 [Deltaproteobacteria bacterium]
MNDQQNTVENDATPQPLDERLADVLATIDQDASTDAERYLRQTEVPAGGE